MSLYIYMYILKIRYKGASFIYDVDRIDLSSYDVYARTCTSIEVIQYKWRTWEILQVKF